MLSFDEFIVVNAVAAKTVWCFNSNITNIDKNCYSESRASNFKSFEYHELA